KPINDDIAEAADDQAKHENDQRFKHSSLLNGLEYCTSSIRWVYPSISRFISMRQELGFLRHSSLKLGRVNSRTMRESGVGLTSKVKSIVEIIIPSAQRICLHSQLAFVIPSGFTQTSLPVNVTIST